MPKQLDLGKGFHAEVTNEVIISDENGEVIILTLRQFKELADFVRDETRKRGEE